MLHRKGSSLDGERALKAGPSLPRRGKESKQKAKNDLGSPAGSPAGDSCNSSKKKKNQVPPQKKGVINATATSNTSPGPQLPVGGFYRRELPLPSLALSSVSGKRLAKEAMAAGTMECFFCLSEAFHTQAEPAF